MMRATDLDYVQIDSRLVQAAVRALSIAKRHGCRLVTAESCTGGLISTVLSEAPGAAEHFAGGFVVYTAEQKYAALKIPKQLIADHGTVSKETAIAMAANAAACSEADIAVAVTGVAGPEPDERGNPIGLTYIACALPGGITICVKRELGDIGRANIRYETAFEALSLLTRWTEEAKG
jgi:PncC family amidohydrolase